jgi:protease-4
VDAIRRALIDFKDSGKFVVAYADDYTQAGYFLASVADEIYLNPLGTLGLAGFSSQTMFYKGILEKAGIEMMVFKVGKYKGAVEPFIADQLSDENREQITSYQNGIWNTIVNGIAKSRNLQTSDVTHFADEGLFMADPSSAIECGLIHALKYRSEVEQLLMDKAGQTGNSLKTIGLGKMKRAKKFVREYRNKIAVIYAEGEITTSTPSYTNSNKITEKFVDELKKLKDDEHIKAVVIRVNSPGGSAFVSEQIWKQVIDLKAVKPVVISMGNVAASGGYYISCGANKIVAEANTLTGSIGIFGLFPNVSGLFDKLALTTDGVKTNRYADLGDASRPMTADEMALFQGFVERGYDVFLTRCAEGRDMSKEAIDAIGQGRVWTGAQALEIGLVDELGGVDRAIALAAEISKIVNYTVINVSTSKDFIKELLEKQIDNAKTATVKDMLGNEYEYYKTLQQVKSTQGIQARLPYDLRPL